MPRIHPLRNPGSSAWDVCQFGNTRKSTTSARIRPEPKDKLEVWTNATQKHCQSHCYCNSFVSFGLPGIPMMGSSSQPISTRDSQSCSEVQRVLTLLIWNGSMVTLWHPPFCSKAWDQNAWNRVPFWLSLSLEHGWSMWCDVISYTKNLQSYCAES